MPVLTLIQSATSDVPILRIIGGTLMLLGFLTTVGGPALFFWFRKEFAARGSAVTPKDLAEALDKFEAKVNQIVHNILGSSSADQIQKFSLLIEAVKDLKETTNKALARAELSENRARDAENKSDRAIRETEYLKEFFTEKLTAISNDIRHLEDTIRGKA